MEKNFFFLDQKVFIFYFFLFIVLIGIPNIKLIFSK
jgi:hypothetical protein